MKVFEHDEAEQFLKLIVPEKILNLKPVLAGGFVLAIYYQLMRYSDPRYLKDFRSKIEMQSKLGDKYFISKLDFKKNFEDIDFWFLKDNEIWNPENSAHNLVKKHDLEVAKLNMKLTAAQLKNMTMGTNPVPNPVPNSFIDELKVPYNSIESIEKFIPGARIKSSTYWANTIVSQMDSLTFQFITKPYDSVEHLFSGFDLINCCIAYHDGKFYFHDDFEKSHDEKMLCKGNGFKKKTFTSKVWTLARSFKYVERYSLTFASDVMEDAISIFLDAVEIRNRIKKQDYDSKSKKILLLPPNYNPNEEIIDDSPYGPTHANDFMYDIGKLSGQISGIERHFETMMHMKTFNNDRIFLFINSEYPIKKYIEEKISEINLKEASK